MIYQLVLDIINEWLVMKYFEYYALVKHAPHTSNPLAHQRAPSNSSNGLVVVRRSSSK